MQGVYLSLIQVGGFADGAADAAPSPARWRARAPRQAHASQHDPKMKRKREGRSRPAEPLGAGIRFPFARIFRFSLFLRRSRSVAFWHPCNGLRADDADPLSFIPTAKGVGEQELLIFYSRAADDIFIHDIGKKKLRQSFGIYDLLT